MCGKGDIAIPCMRPGRSRPMARGMNKSIDDLRDEVLDLDLDSGLIN